MYFDIKAVPFKYCTPSFCCADCCDSLPQSRGDSFRVHRVHNHIGEGRESCYAFYFLAHERKTISPRDLLNSANENSMSWALLMIITWLLSQ